MSSGSISVIMVSYFTGPILLDALEAAASDPEIAEIILVDNGNPASDRLTLCETALELGKARILQGHGNVGFARACNYGAALATGDMLLFLNPDAVIKKGAARRLAEAGGGQAIPSIMGGLIVDENGQELRGSRRGRLTVLSLITTFLPLVPSKFDRSKELLPSDPTPMPTVSGAFLMMDRASFELVSGFDGAYFLHVEDIALCREARRLDGSVIFVPDARARHKGATSKASTWTVERHKLRGVLRYFWTAGPGLGSKLTTILIAPLLATAIAGRACVKSLISAR